MAELVRQGSLLAWGMKTGSAKVSVSPMTMTGFVLNMAGFVLNMAGFVLNMTGFVLNMTFLS